MNRSDWRTLYRAGMFLVGAALLLLSARAAFSQELEDRGAWFKSLKQPVTGMSCCDVSDCRVVKADQDQQTSQWSATILPGDRVTPQLVGKAIPVPPEKVLDRLSVDGDAYLCSGASGAVYCFVPPMQGM